MIVCVRMSTCSCCARSSALRSGRTPNAITIAPDAEASSTSFSVTAPTPEPMIFSFTWSVESFGSISLSTSTEPCTSPLITIPNSLTSPAFSCSWSWSSVMREPLMRAIAASRCLPWRYSTMCRALASSVTWKRSPASGTPCNPSTSTGVDGGASVTTRPRSSNIARTFPKTDPQIKKSPDFSVPFCISIVATGPRPLSTRDSSTVPVAGASGLALSSRKSATSKIVSSSVSMPCFFFAETSTNSVSPPHSAKKKQGIEKLLETILLVADLRELKANPDAPATGTVLESRVDKGRGPVATILIQNGTLNSGDFFICGSVFGKVRAMFDDRGRVVKAAPPSTPVEVLGLQGVPDAGDLFQVTDEGKARHIVDYRQGKQRDAAMARISGSRITLDQLHEQLKAGDVKELGIVIKADVQGSVEVLSEMLPKLSTDQVKLKIIGSGVGAGTENDVLLAAASGAIVIAFGTRPDRKALDLAQQEHVDIRTHTIIYEVSDELKKAMEGMLEPVVTETYLGRAEVRNTFRVKGAGTIAGCYVVDGILKRDAQVRVLRDGAVIYTSKLNSLKRFKDDASEVRTGFECGAGVANFNDIKVGDVLECFSVSKMSAAEAAGQASAPAGRSEERRVGKECRSRWSPYH